MGRIRLKKKNTLSYLILKKLADVGVVSVGAFFPTRYPEARFWRELLGFDEKYSFSRERFSKMLSKLKSEGLVQRTGWKSRSVWEITATGKKRLRELDEDMTLPKADGVARLVIFDVPETEKKKRDWLRVQLIFADYKPLQKSAWIGVRPLSEKFMKDINTLGLEKYLHIFSILNPGTLEKDAD